MTTPDDLIYADTEITGVVAEGNSITINATGYDEAPMSANLLNARIVSIIESGIGRVETGKIIKLKNGKRRLFFYDDDDELFLEVEYMS